MDEETVLGCLRTKLAVVAEDERDAGRRQVLNLGHTVGHAIEAATGYRRYRHGEAVGVGLLAALRLSGREALRVGGGRAAGRARPPHNLRRRHAGRGRGASWTATRSAATGGSASCSCSRPGDVTPGHAVAPADLRAAVEEVHAG